MVVMGDMNACTGMIGERMKWNGEMLVECGSEMDLKNLNETSKATCDLAGKESRICD